MTSCHDISSWDDGEDLQSIRFQRIVVGVDGSPNSLAALRLAGALGLRDGAKLEVVCAYRPYFEAEYPFASGIPSYGPVGEATTREAYPPTNGVVDAAADAYETLERAARTVFGSMQPSGIAGLELRPVEGSPHDVLTRLALDADLLVVGARGHSGPLGLLLGSTAQACARHAPCPVLVVPAQEHVHDEPTGPDPQQQHRPVTH
jgi:nucleotide-binding universal stress UspA family protein